MRKPHGRAAGDGHRVLESLFDRPIVSVADVRAIIGTSYTAANNLVLILLVLGPSLTPQITNLPVCRHLHI